MKKGRFVLILILLGVGGFLGVVLPRMLHVQTAQLFMGAPYEKSSFFRRPFAHRGLYSPAAPENSLVAFGQAIEKSYGIELDLHLSADGEVMVCHDDQLSRLTGYEGSISQMRASDVKKLALLGTSEKIPTLIEVLNLVKGRVPLLIELKGENLSLAEKTYEILRAYQGEVAVISFNEKLLAWFYQYAPHILRGQTSLHWLKEPVEDMSWTEKLLKTLFLHNRVSHPHFLIYDHKFLSNPFVRVVARFFPFLVYNVRKGESLGEYASIIDAVIFDP